MTSNEQAIYIFALRYATPRQSYAFSLVYTEIVNKFREFRKSQLKHAAEDIRNDMKMYKYFAQWERESRLKCADRLDKLGDELDD